MTWLAHSAMRPSRSAMPSSSMSSCLRRSLSWGSKWRQVSWGHTLSQYNSRCTAWQTRAEALCDAANLKVEVSVDSTHISYGKCLRCAKRNFVCVQSSKSLNRKQELQADLTRIEQQIRAETEQRKRQAAEKAIKVNHTSIVHLSVMQTSIQEHCMKSHLSRQVHVHTEH